MCEEYLNVLKRNLQKLVPATLDDDGLHRDLCVLRICYSSILFLMNMVFFIEALHQD